MKTYSSPIAELERLQEWKRKQLAAKAMEMAEDAKRAERAKRINEQNKAILERQVRKRNQVKIEPQISKGQKPAKLSKRGLEFVKTGKFLWIDLWRDLRKQVLEKYGEACMKCGATPKTGAIINVDHIKPRKTHPELALTFSNLQVLCSVCNKAKGNKDTTDYRRIG